MGRATAPLVRLTPTPHALPDRRAHLGEGAAPILPLTVDHASTGQPFVGGYCGAAVAISFKVIARPHERRCVSSALSYS